MIQSMTSNEFETVIRNNALVFVDFWASWCAPCKQFEPIYQRVAENYPQIIFSKIDIEKEPELAEALNIRSIPHLMIFKEGIAIYSESGSMPESMLKDLAEQAIAADVSKIREQLEQEGAE